MKIGKKMAQLLEEGLSGTTPKFLKVYIMESGFFKVEILGIENEHSIDNTKTIYFSVGRFKRKSFIKTLVQNGMMEIYKNCYVNASYFCRFETNTSTDDINSEYLHAITLYGRHGEIVSSNLTEDQYNDFMIKIKKVRPDMFFIYENNLKRNRVTE
jgi:hypothetical protein